MVANFQAVGRTRRLNPFAFPSDTDFRFAILIFSVLGASVFIYGYLYLTIPIASEFTTVMSGQCLTAAQAASPGDTVADLAAFASAYEQCAAPIDRIQVEWVGLGLALLFSTAGVIYWALPAWKIWRGGLVPLHADNTPPGMLEQLAHLCRETRLSRFPVFLLNPYSAESSGVTFGRLGRYYLVLNSGLVMQFHKDRSLFCAIVLHELGHIRNADVDKTYFTIAIGWAFGVAALLPWGVSQFFPPWHFDQTFNIGWRVLILTALVYLTRNAVLRSREVYADIRASVWDGQTGALGRVLNSLPPLKGGRWQRLLHKHPDPKERYKALSDTSGLFRQSFWEAFVTGVVVTDAITNVEWLLNLLHIGVGLGPLGAGVIFAPLVVGIVGLGAWRSTFAARVRGGGLPGTTQVSLGLTLGLLLGQPLSLLTSQTGSGYFLSVDPPLGQFTLPPLIAQVGLPLLWSILLLLLVFFFLRWIVASAAIWLEVAARSASPRRTYWLALIIASGVLGIFFGLFVRTQDITQTAIDSVNSAPIRETIQTIVSTSGLDPRFAPVFVLISYMVTDPFICLAFISLWAYPLVAWFWRRRTTMLAGSSWAFLDTSSYPHHQTGPYDAPFRPGLALGMGLAGGLAFCILLLLFVSGLHLALSYDEVALLAVLLQGGIAAIVASYVRKLGGLHGLFAAFVAGCTMTLGILGFGLFSHGTIDLNFAGNVFLQVVNDGALLALLVGCTVSALARWSRHFSRRGVNESVI